MSELKNWYTYLDGEIAGPFTKEEIENLLFSSKHIQIWGRGQVEWMSAEDWRNFVAAEKNTEKTTARWRVRVNHKELHPMKHEELINFLKTQDKISAIELSTGEGAYEWKEVYAFNQIKDDLDLSRRTHTRVPLLGTLTCFTDDGPMDMKIISISEAGIGATSEKPLRVGEKLSATIQSPNLHIAINCKCEVLYLGEKGFVGLGFGDLPPEFKKALTDYINKFTDKE